MTAAGSPTLESTYKARDVEETIDIWFYRPIGYAIAKVCQKLGITPNAVTVISIVIGVTGGRLLYYRDFAANLWGIVLWIVADTLDSVDGQLARMTGHKSKIGRILDGLGGNLMFVSIYLHLWMRMVDTYPGLGWLPLLAVTLVGGFSHSVQSAMADYYRNAYLRFVVDPAKSELESADEVRAEWKGTPFRTHPVKKVLLAIYLDYTKKQERYSRNFQRLRKRAEGEFGRQVPAWFAEEYRRRNKPLMKYYAILTTNTRMIILSVCVLADFVPGYFLAEIVGINCLMVLVTMHQEKLSLGLLGMLEAKRSGARHQVAAG